MRGLACIWTIAINTIRESVRNKVLYGLLFFAILLIGSGTIVSSRSRNTVLFKRRIEAWSSRACALPQSRSLCDCHRISLAIEREARYARCRIR